MLQQELRRDYFFELAGMPQSGKSAVREIVAHLLKRNGFFIEEYIGGSRGSALYNAPIADLNLSLALKTAGFVLETVRTKKAVNRIFLLDRGLIDRCIFTDTLLRHHLIDAVSAQTINNLLTLPKLLDNIDGVYVLVTSPEVALEREYRNKLIRKEGEVMNPGFLSTMRSVAEESYNDMRNLIRNRNLVLIDTGQDDEHLQQIAESIIRNIMHVITTY